MAMGIYARGMEEKLEGIPVAFDVPQRPGMVRKDLTGAGFRKKRFSPFILLLAFSLSKTAAVHADPVSPPF